MNRQVHRDQSLSLAKALEQAGAESGLSGPASGPRPVWSTNAHDWLVLPLGAP